MSLMECMECTGASEPSKSCKWGVVVEGPPSLRNVWLSVAWFKTRGAAVAYGRRVHPQNFGICRIERLGGKVV